MPEGADTAAINAKLKDGVLTVSIKKKAGNQPKKIDIKSHATASKAQ